MYKFYRETVLKTEPSTDGLSFKAGYLRKGLCCLHTLTDPVISYLA